MDTKCGHTWTHSICVPCWNEKNPDKITKDTYRGNNEACCYCGRFTNAGIFVRDDPANFPVVVDSDERASSLLKEVLTASTKKEIEEKHKKAGQLIADHLIILGVLQRGSGSDVGHDVVKHLMENGYLVIPHEYITNIPED